MSSSLFAISWGELIERWPLFAVLVLVASIVFLVSNRIVFSVMKRRLSRLENVEHFEAVPTATPYEDPEAKARANASKNIRTRYSVIRIMLATCLMGGVAVAALFPMMNAIPQALVSFLVAIGIAVVGVAARPLVENLIAGAVLSFSNQLRIGDTVLLDGEHYGTVEDIDATHTVLKLWDWRRYVVPNSKMLSKEIVHLSHKDAYLWAHVEFFVSGRTDLKIVEKIAVEAARRSKFFANFEDPQFWVRDFAPTTIKCWVAAWARSPEDAWYLRAEIRLAIAEGFREAGIEGQTENISISGASGQHGSPSLRFFG